MRPNPDERCNGMSSRSQFNPDHKSAILSSFLLGVNYWASHAGTRMWSDWREDVVEADLRQIHAAGLRALRVFPLWPDFQPLTLLRGCQGLSREYRFGERPLPDDEMGQAGVSVEAIARFETFLNLADRYQMQCVVPLINGWMSGRLFVPPAFDGMNVLTDPEVIRWQVRFVRYFAGRFRSHPAILAWELGNECNCLGAITTPAQAYVWTSALCQTLRAMDQDHPIVSGMHGLKIEGNWKICDQGELTDVMTVHPYPIFTKYCDQDPINTIRPILHGTAQCRLFADVAGRPGLCEEIGTLGPLIASEEVSADFVRSCLWSLWANDCHGLFWWCAYDQEKLEHAPYDWDAVERELGLFRSDRSLKPVCKEIRLFRDWLRKIPFSRLPAFQRDAVCLLSQNQDHWAVAFSAFILAKQAGFDIEFQAVDQPLKESELYLLPCLSSHQMISARRMKVLLERIERGAALYLSLDSGLPSGFEPMVGLKPATRARRQQAATISVTADNIDFTLSVNGKFRGCYETTRARVLGREPDGNPAFTVAEYGKGRIYFLSVPLEQYLAETPGVFHAPTTAFWKIYQIMAQTACAKRAVNKTQPQIGVTAHPIDAQRRLVIAINYSPDPMTETLTLRKPWSLERVLYGESAGQNSLTAVIKPNDAMVFQITRD